MAKIIVAWMAFLFVIALVTIFFIWNGNGLYLQNTVEKSLATAVVIIFFLVLSHFYHIVAQTIRHVVVFIFKTRDKTDFVSEDQAKPQDQSFFTQLKQHLSYRYGWRWRSKHQWILVIGEVEQVNQALPNLIAQGWLENQQTLLLWGGSTQTELDRRWLLALRKLRGYRRLDAIVWVIDSTIYALGRAEKARQEKALWQQFHRHKLLGWAAPLYLLDVRQEQWQLAEQDIPCVGALFQPAHSLAQRLDAIKQVVKQSISSGMNQLVNNNHNRYLLQLTQDIEQNDIHRLNNYLAPFSQAHRYLVLRGLFFTPGLSNHEQEQTAFFQPTPVWQKIITDSYRAKGKHVGFSIPTAIAATVLTLALFYLAGASLSFFNQSRQIQHSYDLVQAAQQTDQDQHSKLVAQRALQDQLSQLLYQVKQGAPWYQRFGLNQNRALLAQLWPYYQQINERNLIKPISQQLHSQLNQILYTAPAKRHNSIDSKLGYDQLKAYLMMGSPQRAEASLLVQGLSQPTLRPEQISAGDWQSQVPELLRFYADNLSQHQGWAIKTDNSLIRDVRQVLLNQIGLKNAETTIYQGILRRVAQNYAPLTLNQMLNGTDSRMLFYTDDEVAGIFTRQAWNGMVEKEIEQAVKSRHEEIDWVLSDGGLQASQSISPERLKENLTQRYFTDYSAAWLHFLNSIQWRRTNSISEAIDQLTLLSDVRQSPLIALMETVRYQGLVGQKRWALSDDIVKSAKDMFSQNEKAQRAAGLVDDLDPGYPLQGTFAPVIALLDKSDGGESSLSLQTYLTRVTRVRLKLQQITTSANPQAMTEALAKTVFQGKSIDLTDTRDYGNLIAASFGAEWHNFGHNLFVSPLEQAWQAVLEPASLSFNNNWHESVVNPWHQAFSGRYPFHKTKNDASLAELSRFLRPESGVIDRFIATELSGVLVKQGNKWVPNELNMQGLRFNPQFLQAINQLNELASILFVHGDARLEFEIMPLGTQGVTKTELVVDDLSLLYFNQRENWRLVKWPGESPYPKAQLNWSTTHGGLQAYDDYRGHLAFIRLLERARVEQIDSSRYLVSWFAVDGHHLKYMFRTSQGNGPLALTALRGFNLPGTVFEPVNSGPTETREQAAVNYIRND